MTVGRNSLSLDCAFYFVDLHSESLVKVGLQSSALYVDYRVQKFRFSLPE